jgi:hypothetical protein
MYTFVSAGPYAGMCAACCWIPSRGIRIWMQRWEGKMNVAMGDHGFKHLLKRLNFFDK